MSTRAKHGRIKKSDEASTRTSNTLRTIREDSSNYKSLHADMDASSTDGVEDRNAEADTAVDESPDYGYEAKEEVASDAPYLIPQMRKIRTKN